MISVAEDQRKYKQTTLGVCIFAGTGFGISLGILFGAAFGNSIYMIAGLVFGNLLGLAIGKSLEEVSENIA